MTAINLVDHLKEALKRPGTHIVFEREVAEELLKRLISAGPDPSKTICEHSGIELEPDIEGHVYRAPEVAPWARRRIPPDGC